jgi:FkbM family methyltransferase
LGKNLGLLLKLIKYIGFSNTMRVMFQRFRRPASETNSPYPLHVSGFAEPIYFRPYTSDAGVFWTVFRQGGYACVGNVSNPSLIIDCGANAGYSALYFLQRYPNARVIAVEPDPANFALLEKNVAPFRDRVKLICAGVWSHATWLRMKEGPSDVGSEWAKQVRECNPGEESSLPAVDIGTILKESGFEKISILKVDIERAETVVFAKNYEQWIHQVDNLAIELHDEECERIFFAAIKDIPFTITKSGELTVCKK